jgi:hypothetical protein
VFVDVDVSSPLEESSPLASFATNEMVVHTAGTLLSGWVDGSVEPFAPRFQFEA